jgi:peptidoglycan/LPS O-acetylase OafA/YrhL
VQTWGRIGPIGVDVFFVLSGLLITTLLCRERDRKGKVSLRGFYWRRSLRIVPAFAALLLFVAALQLAGAISVSGRDWLAALTYTMNFRPHSAWELGHLWSLSIEEHFYLAWPLLFVCLPPRWALRGLAAILVAGPVLRWAVLLWWPQGSSMLDVWTPTRLDAIAVGCLTALLARTPGGAGRLNALSRWWPLALIAVVGSLAGALHSGKFANGVAPTVTALSFGVLIWAAATRAPRWLESRPLVTVGIGSYSLYLWQQPFLNPRAELWWTAFPQNLVLACLAALLSYRLIERPLLRLRGRHSSPPMSLPEQVADHPSGREQVPLVVGRVRKPLESGQRK